MEVPITDLAEKNKALFRAMQNIPPFTLRKWNFPLHKYEIVRNEWDLILAPPESTTTRCASCKESLLVDISYSSIQWCNDVGFGFPVCEKCHEEEFKQREKHPIGQC